ncbi:MAG: DUF2961 domain-containing protein [Fimbriimonadaceae bacterium]|nr:DUF2961 domain-containing protein [Fimbriimonadaceae bacterium]
MLADLGGAGIIKHIWITLSCPDPMIRRKLVLRCFWDGHEHPSVESPLGDFFGQGWGMNYTFSSLPLAAAPKDGMSLVSYWPMPFGEGARVVLENQSDSPVEALYFYVDYEEHARIGEDVPRFFAWYNQESTWPEGAPNENEWGVLGGEEPKNQSTTQNYVFCEASGRGHFAGVNFYVQNPGPMWYGEGDDMFLIDGEPWPGTLHGTGTEDYFNQCWCPDELFSHPYFGTARVPGVENRDPRFGWMGRTHVYRYHIEDPIRFRSSLRATIEHGHANVMSLNLASVAYWYQTMPGRAFPVLAPVDQRIPGPDTSVVDVHRWRDAWRRSRGGGRLWGNETG